MKNMARDLIKVHYKEAIFPVIEFDHNSDQETAIIAENVKKLLNESLFLQGPLDTQVSILFISVLS
jgi:hypothetical protein